MLFSMPKSVVMVCTKKPDRCFGNGDFSDFYAHVYCIGIYGTNPTAILGLRSITEHFLIKSLNIMVILGKIPRSH